MRKSTYYTIGIVALGFVAAFVISFRIQRDAQVSDQRGGVAEVVSGIQPVSDGGGPGLVDLESEIVDLPLSVRHEVPFTPQAPFANWGDYRYQNACEEASILMAWSWLQNDFITPAGANQAIADMVEFEKVKYGFYVDSSAEDTARLFREYYQHLSVTVSRDVTVERIKEELASGNLVIVPLDGRLLGNPFFTSPGPTRHMVVITGYDESNRKFITNEPGTKRGEDFEYSYEVLLNAVRDYASGDHEPINDAEKVMIVVGK